MNVLHNLLPVYALDLSVPHGRAAEEQRFAMWQGPDGLIDSCLTCTQDHISFLFERIACPGDWDRARGKQWPNSDLTPNP